MTTTGVRSHRQAVTKAAQAVDIVPGWVTTKVALAVPEVTVHVPVLAEVAVFAVTLAVSVAPEEPDAGAHVSHDAFDEADHDPPLVTVAVVDWADAVGIHVVFDNDTLAVDTPA